MMFALPTGTAAKLVHVNIRGELHGSDVVPQADIRFEVAMPNAILDAFDPALRTCLYTSAPPAHPQAKLPELPGIEPVSDTPALRFPELLMPLRWEAEGKGYRLTVEAPLLAFPLALEDVVIGAIRLDCLDGGTVAVEFRAQTTQAPDVETIAELARMVQRTVRVGLEAPIEPDIGTLEEFPASEAVV
jgi:hypothetical protein